MIYFGEISETAIGGSTAEADSAEDTNEKIYWKQGLLSDDTRNCGADYDSEWHHELCGASG